MSRQWSYQDERLCHGCIHDFYIPRTRKYRCNLVSKEAVEKYELQVYCPFYKRLEVKKRVWIDEDGFYHVREEEQE